MAERVIGGHLPPPPPRFAEPEVTKIDVTVVNDSTAMARDHIEAIPQADEVDRRALAFMAERVRDARIATEFAAKELVLRMAANNFTFRDIAEHSGYPISMVQKWIREAEIEMKRGRPARSLEVNL